MTKNRATTDRASFPGGRKETRWQKEGSYCQEEVQEAQKARHWSDCQSLLNPAWSNYAGSSVRRSVLPLPPTIINEPPRRHLPFHCSHYPTHTPRPTLHSHIRCQTCDVTLYGPPGWVLILSRGVTLEELRSEPSHTNSL